jgi:ABC-type transporter Mla subunit MlaD
MRAALRARLDAIDEALAELTDYASDALDVLRDIRDQGSEVAANTAPDWTQN